ncbi:hypothetical protein T02_596 [Trichinella nativa]|uniref:Uncharacterized protein n=1 Tax=Trichinella nativa TaxID=6335 RepID=A0A0V1LD91_9BILA|nr:hypothetical protein T02_596 [Trichinella nativa]
MNANKPEAISVGSLRNDSPKNTIPLCDHFAVADAEVANSLLEPVNPQYILSAVAWNRLILLTLFICIEGPIRSAMRRVVRRPVDKACNSVQEDANEYAKLWKLIHASCATKLNFLSEPLHKAIGESSLNVKTDSTLFKHPGERSKKERQKTAEQVQELKGERKIQRLLRNAGITVFKSKINNIVTKIVVDTGAALALVTMDQTGEALEESDGGAIFIAGARVWLLCQRSKRKLSKKLSRPGHVSFELVQRIFKLGKDAKTDCSEGIHGKTGGVREHSSASERREYRIEELYNPRPSQKARQLNYYMIEELLQKQSLRKTAAECATYAALAVRSMTSENSAMRPESAMEKL